VADEAAQLDPDSDPAAGYVALITGRARALEGERNYVPWAEALEGRWDQAGERVAAKWGDRAGAGRQTEKCPYS
jgi:hypothetical protein